MLAHHKGTTFHQQLATTPALSSATCVPARSYRTFGIVHFARPFQPGRKRSEKANTQSHNVPYKLQTATHVFLGAKQSETTIKNAASGCWMMLGCWCMLQYVTMLGQAAGSKASLISSKFFLTHSSASGTTPSENLGRIPWYPHL